MYESELIIAVRNGNGEIIASQTFEEFMNGRKNIEILNRTIMQLKIKKENENKRLNMES